MDPRLILASESPRRRELLRKLTPDFAVEAAQVAEQHAGAAPETLPQRNAEAKALAVSQLHPDALVLGADTAIVLAGKLWGKPADLAAARAMLRTFSGQTHQVITALALVRGSRVISAWSETATVRFRSLSDADISAYLAAVKVLDKAGAYAIQEHGEMVISELSGDRDTVIGLPLGRLRRELAACSVPLTAPDPTAAPKR